jgi:SAM-dependent methyltransferase
MSDKPAKEYRDATPEAEFDRHADGYSEAIDQELNSYGADHEFFTRHKARLIERLLATRGLDSAQMDLLDVGCGVGKIHAHLGPRFRSVFGVDISATSIAEASASFPEHSYAVYDGDRLPVADASADLCIAICVFHHVPPLQWESLAVEMLRALRPDGFALVIEHNPYNPVTRRIVNSCPMDKNAILLTRRQTAQLFEPHATDVISRSILSVPPLNGFCMSVDSLFGCLPLGAQYYCLAKAPTSTKPNAHG